MKKVKLIYNPKSGDNRILDSLDDIIAIYQRRGYTIIPFRLTFDYDDQEIARDLDQTYDHILLAGGDGTVNHIVNIMKSRGLDIPLAVLPTGTANDFAKLMGVPTDIATACKRILSGEITAVDLGKVNDRYFVNVFSSGLFTDISQRTPTALKNTLGKLVYYMSGIGELPNFRKMHIRVEEQGKEIFQGSALMLFVFNGQTAGNLKIAYLSDETDGLLDLLIVKGDHIVETIRTVTAFLRRPSDHYPKDIVHLRSCRMQIFSDSSETTDMDGEAGPSFPLHITCEPKALRVMRPKRELSKK
ncbi:MAG: YegS/Rv2252/BmrU family lipid kinase [Rikenellaceae bacterium]|nr:YegS/Rv2252/BmrU family lipid kinase [Rikenellaceae bacterium]